MMNYQQLINSIITQGYYLQENFLAKKNAIALKKQALGLLKNNQFTAAKIGSFTKAVDNKQIRRDKIYWLEEDNPEPAIQAYLQAMQKIAACINQHLYLGLVTFETHFAFYETGSFYKKHVDQFSHKKDRKLSIIYYLNDEWQPEHGGELNLYDQQDNLLACVSPVFNRLICFTSDLPHEVALTMQPRLSIAGWFKSRSGI